MHLCVTTWIMKPFDFVTFLRLCLMCHMRCNCCAQMQKMAEIEFKVEEYYPQGANQQAIIVQPAIPKTKTKTKTKTRNIL